MYKSVILARAIRLGLPPKRWRWRWCPARLPVKIELQVDWHTFTALVLVWRDRHLRRNSLSVAHDQPNLSEEEVEAL
jgi:hypothetical protein